MRVLALHTTSRGCFTALCDGERQSHREGPQASTGLPVLLDELLRAAGLALRQIDLVAVAVGPGSFTGIKIGLACAWGLALGARVPLAGVGSLDALAGAADRSGPLLALAQAYGPWIYAARFDVESPLAPVLDGEYRVVRRDQLATIVVPGAVVAIQGLAGIEHELPPGAVRDVVEPDGAALAVAVARLGENQVRRDAVRPAQARYLRADPDKAW